MTVLTVFFVLVGGFVGGKQGALIAFLFAAATNVFSYWFSDKMVLKKYNAMEVTANIRAYPEFVTHVGLQPVVAACRYGFRHIQFTGAES